MTTLPGFDPVDRKPHRTGMGAHHSPSADTHTWLTPRSIIEGLGPFDLDPCACPDPRPWPTAAIHWTRDDSPLSRAWRGRVWLNPPYGGPTIVGPWMRRMAAHGSGTALIFARTETDVFHETVWGAAIGVLFLRGRLSFARQDGTTAGNNAGAPSCLVAYGTEDMARLKSSGLPGCLVRLR